MESTYNQSYSGIESVDRFSGRYRQLAELQKLCYLLWKESK